MAIKRPFESTYISLHKDFKAQLKRLFSTEVYQKIGRKLRALHSNGYPTNDLRQLTRILRTRRIIFGMIARLEISFKLLLAMAYSSKCLTDGEC